MPQINRWRDGFKPTLTEIILEALKENKFDWLRGIQSLDSPIDRWQRLQNMASIINNLFEMTKSMRYKAEKLRKEIEENEMTYLYQGIFEKKKEELEEIEAGRIYFMDLKTRCSDISQRLFMENIEYLEQSGFIETDRVGGWEHACVWLPRSIWDGFVDFAIQRGGEQDVFTDALGVMIGLAASPGTIPKTLRPWINAMIKASKNNNEIELQVLEEEYLRQGVSKRKMTNAIKRDSKKNENIQMIDSTDDRKLIFRRDAIMFVTLWNTRANTRVQRMLRERSS